jgi:hypothetical protein
MWRGPVDAPADLDRIQDAGLTVVRLDVQWDQLEPTTKGSFNLAFAAQLDTVLDMAQARGLRPIIVLLGTPAWARGGAGTSLTPPTRLEDYGDALGFLAARYANRPGMVYEIWNEPNLAIFWNTPSGPNASHYAQLLRHAYTRIKLADPDATALGGSIAFNDTPFLTAMYQAGARGFFDGLAIHPYSQGRGPDDRVNVFESFILAVEDLGGVMSAQGEPSKPIWITEMGWGTNQVSDLARADYYHRAVELVRRWTRVVAFVAYQLRQDDDFPDYGLITPDARNNTASQTAFSVAVRLP